MKDLRRILDDVERGRDGAAERLTVLLYDELRDIARRELASERRDHTLQPTALAHEAFMRLSRSDRDGFASRSEFLAGAAIAIRRVLVEHARRRSRQKRGGDRARIDLADVDPAGTLPDRSLLDLDEALDRLADFSATHARTVELHFFAGMTFEEIAAHKDISVSTVGREWRFARAWLRGELEDPDGP